MRGVVIVLLSLLSVGCGARRVKPPSTPTRMSQVDFDAKLRKFNDVYAPFSRAYFGCPLRAVDAKECVPEAGVWNPKVYEQLTELCTKVWPVRKEKQK